MGTAMVIDKRTLQCFFVHNVLEVCRYDDGVTGLNVLGQGMQLYRNDDYYVEA